MRCPKYWYHPPLVESGDNRKPYKCTWCGIEFYMDSKGNLWGDEEDAFKWPQNSRIIEEYEIKNGYWRQTK